MTVFAIFFGGDSATCSSIGGELLRQCQLFIIILSDELFISLLRNGMILV